MRYLSHPQIWSLLVFYYFIPIHWPKISMFILFSSVSSHQLFQFLMLTTPMVDTLYLYWDLPITIFLGHEGMLGFYIIKKKQNWTLSTQYGLIYVKRKIKDVVIYINTIIWGCILVLYLESTDFRCNLNKNLKPWASVV